MALQGSSMKQFEEKLYRDIQSKIQMVDQYNTPGYIQQGYKVIPFERLHETVQAQLAPLSLSCKKSEFLSKDLLIIQLMNWFKSEFFTWVDTPECPMCLEPTSGKKYGTLLAEELKDGASRVELYSCSECNMTVRFPRYNDCMKLLVTRKGRCGEWANCFTFLCYCLGIEARLIVDWTDHVWTEVFSEDLDRWVHCDPCEGAWDQPLLYESGWGKKLSYIFAFSPEEVQDVTWRYSSDFKAVLRRREACEYWLLSAVDSTNAHLQGHCSQERKQQIKERLVCDLASMLVPRTANEEEQRGRKSGCLAWRIARGEA